MKKPVTDLQIGAGLRAARRWRDMSQSQLGDGIGCTYQMVQKYEAGTSPITLPRWLQACAVLDMTPATMLGLVEKPTRPGR
jgi:transcriptional regulator with XRE-family HTH domain